MLLSLCVSRARSFTVGRLDAWSRPSLALLSSHEESESKTPNRQHQPPQQGQQQQWQQSNKILQLSTADVLPLREAVLWPGRPDLARLPQDDDGIHFGYYPSHDQSSTESSSQSLQHSLRNEMEKVPPFSTSLGQQKTVGVVSLFLVNQQQSQQESLPQSTPLQQQEVVMAQFRKLAVHPTWRGRGIGSRLVKATMEYIIRQNYNNENTTVQNKMRQVDSSASHEQPQPMIRILFCDARAHQAGFYERLGFRPVGQPFDKYGSRNKRETATTTTTTSKSTRDESKLYVRMELDLVSWSADAGDGNKNERTATTTT